MADHFVTAFSTFAPHTRQVAIVGLNDETAALLPSLMQAEGVQVIKILNHELEDLNRLAQYPHLSTIIDTTNSPVIAARLRKLPLRKVEIISGVSARLLFCTVRSPTKGNKDSMMRSLEEIRDTVSLAKNRDEILKTILNTAVKTSGADCGSLMLLDPSKRHLTIEAAYGLNEKVVVSSITQVGKGVSGIAVRSGKPILLQGMVDKAAYASDYHRPDLVSSICCPLMFGLEAVGVINISSKSADRVFVEADVDFLEELAQLTAEVVKTSHESTSNLQSNYVLGLLNSVREILSLKYRFEERLNLLLMKIANAFDAKECTFYEFNPLDRNFAAKASSATSVSLLKERPILLDDFFAQRVLKTGNTICVNATGKNHRSKKWCMLQPIRTGKGQEIVGTLYIYLNSEKNSLRDETTLLRKIGEMLSRELGKNRELESLRIQSLKYSAISQFSFDLANAGSLPEMTKMILANVRHILESETCVLRLRNTQVEKLEVIESVSHRNAIGLREILAVDEAVSSEMKPGQGVLWIEDLHRSNYGHGMHRGESAMIAPLELNGEVIGTLSLYDKRTPEPGHHRGFAEQDKEILDSFGMQICKGLKRFIPFVLPADPQDVARVQEIQTHDPTPPIVK